MTNLHSDEDPRGPATTDQINHIEIAIVEHLLSRVQSKLTDRDGVRHSPPWDPKNSVRIGVLRPRIVYPPPADEAGDGVTADDVKAEEAESAIETLTGPPSDPPIIGVDFTIESEEDVGRLNIEVEFAIYHPSLPTRGDARERFRQLVEDDAEIALVEEELASEPDVDVLEVVDHPDSETLDEPESRLSDSPDTSDTSRDPVAARPPNVPVQNAWVRSVVRVGPINISIRPDGQHQVVTDPLRDAVATDTDLHFRETSAARPFRDRTPRTIPQSALDSEETYHREIANRVDSDWIPSVLLPKVTAFAEPLPGGQWLASVSLENATVVEGRPFQDLSMYDCKLCVQIDAPARLIPQRFHLAPDDYRYEPISSIIGHGRACVATAFGPNGICTETLPTYYQIKIESREDHVPTPFWESLASDPLPLLAKTSQAMQDYLAHWRNWIASITEPSILRSAQKDLEDFAGEIERFDLGRRALELDAELLCSFRLANQTFDCVNANNSYHSWRLFQLVYLTSHLPALAARRHRSDPAFMQELDFADVLWFPTGGGKTEAYLGLIITAAFYDRLRGKDRGITAWLKFPLRMLSVQQLGRVLRVLSEAEKLRKSELDGLGDPFELGYLVGGGNTPNSLKWHDRWWPGFDEAVIQLREVPGSLDAHRLVAQCPLCGTRKSISIEVNEAEYRLLHVCRACGQSLPLYITDEEIYRFQPTVIVSTVDKITGFSYYGEFSDFNHGPRLRCPDHGYFSFGKCKAGPRCTRGARDYVRVTNWTDPVPSLIIQDEMHLIREELGAFESHYEGLHAELQRGGESQLSSKILAATATIEQYENQLSQVYGRMPRSFPSQGWDRSSSFYTKETDEVRRIFLGLSPAGGGIAKVDVAGIVQIELLDTIQMLQDDLPLARSIVETATGVVLEDQELAELLFNYEVTLAYVNSKAQGAMINDSIANHNLSLGQDNRDQIQCRVLTSEVPLPELAEVIDQIEDGRLDAPRSQRLRAMIGTSVVSHGVDLERLNCMVMAGLPPTTADYIQATSRSGRIHVGIVVTVFDNFGRREASTFTNFISTHRFLDRLVEPVPVNKYAENAVVRTLPGLIVALLWDLARDPAFGGPADGIRETRNMRNWWNAAAASGLADRLLERLQSAYRAQVTSSAPRALEDRLVHAATNRWLDVEKNQMEMWDGDRTTELFRESVMTSLRDIDIAVQFGGLHDATRIYEALFGYEVD